MECDQIIPDVNPCELPSQDDLIQRLFDAGLITHFQYFRMIVATRNGSYIHVDKNNNISIEFYP